MRNLTILCATVLLAAATPAAAQTLAFPGAEGYGQFSSGGRGGEVYVVDTLADSGPGSLRACVEASGPRSCVFEVAGDIFLKSTLLVRNPDISILGQTAPGQGVQLRSAPGNNETLLKIDAANWIIRHIRVRPGPHTVSTELLDGISVCDTWRPCSGILDHVSASFSVDELVQIPGQDIRGVTISNSLFVWPLNRATPKHPDSPSHAMGVFSQASGGWSVSGSYIGHTWRRSPNLTIGEFGPNGEAIAGYVEWRNNVTYNCAKDCGQTFVSRDGENAWFNIAGSLVIQGPDTSDTGSVGPLYPWECFERTDAQNPNCEVTTQQHYCLQENSAVGTIWPDDIVHGILNPEDIQVVESTDCVNFPVLQPGQEFGLTGAVLGGAATEQLIIDQAGPFWWDRDDLDALAIASLVNRTGAVIDGPDEVGGYPVLAIGVARLDSDQDGMPDDVENLLGLDPFDPSDRNGDLDGDGYTNLEEYGFELAQDQTGGTVPPPPPPVPTLTPSEVYRAMQLWLGDPDTEADFLDFFNAQ